ncbi:unnamed protein product, partial [Vitis vinifera]|uniref:Uncharacterized protein n=1 Tax=Vitis vinifera TaxID=29760 RepID=D7STE8_VITVI
MAVSTTNCHGYSIGSRSRHADQISKLEGAHKAERWSCFISSETANLPVFRDSIELQKQKFIDKGLDDQDLVALVAVTLLELQHANSLVTNYITSTRQLEMVLTPPSTPPSFLSYKLFALKTRLWEDASTRSYVQRFLSIRGL